MSNLLEFTAEELKGFERFEMAIHDNETTTRLMWWFGQERKEPSVRTILKEMGLGEMDAKLRKLEKENKLEMMKDDGTFHITFKNSLLNGFNGSELEWL